MGVETGFSEGAVSSALIRCHLPRVSVQRPSTVYSQFPKTSRIRVIGTLTDKLFSDLHVWLLFVETKGTINKLWQLCFKFLKNF